MTSGDKGDNYFLSFSFFPIWGKETDKFLTVEAIVATFRSTILIFFFKSSTKEFEDEKVWVTTSAIFCWLSIIFERTWFCAIAFSTCQFKAAFAKETYLLVPSGLVPTGFLIFQTCFVLVLWMVKIFKRRNILWVRSWSLVKTYNKIKALVFGFDW